MKKLIPSFLKQLNQYLLLNNPLIWITRVHFVVFFGALFWGLSALIGYVIPLNIQNTQDLGLWNFLFSILAIVVFCFWVYYNVIFNNEKQFGKRSWTDCYKLFFINGFCCFIFFGFSIPFSVVYNHRVANVITDSELIEDINSLNTAEPYLVNELATYEFVKRDSIKNKDSYNVNNCVRFGSYTPWDLKYDTVKFQNLLSEYQLRKQYLLIKTKEQIKEAIDKQKVLLIKYLNIQHLDKDYTENALKNYEAMCKQSPIEYDNMYQNNYGNKTDLESCMRNIYDAKYTTLFVWKSEYLIFMMYLCFYLSILLLLFKMVNWRQFLITAVSFVLIPIILFIFSQLLPYYVFGNFNRSNVYILLIIITSFIAIGFSIKSFFSKKQFWAFGNICSQISFAVLPVLPLLILVIIKDNTLAFFNQAAMVTAVNENSYLANEMVQTNAYYNSPEYLYSQLLADYWRDQFMIWQSLCMYGSIIIFIVVLLPLFNALFVKQLSLPRKS